MTLAPSSTSANSRTTPAQAFIHIIKGNVGPGCLSLPWAVSQMGVGFGVVVIFIVAYWTSYNALQLVLLKADYCEEQRAELRSEARARQYASADSGDSGDSGDTGDSDNGTNGRTAGAISHLASQSQPQLQQLSPSQRYINTNVTYAELSKWLWGDWLEKCTTIFICVQQLAVCTVFLSFIGENLGAALEESFGNIGHATVITMAVPAAMMLSCLPNLKVLAPIMALATTTLFAGFGVLAYLVRQAWKEQVDLDDGGSHSVSDYVPAKLNVAALPLAICAILYSFEGICLVLPIEGSMQEEERDAFAGQNEIDGDHDREHDAAGSSSSTTKRRGAFPMVFTVVMSLVAVIFALVAGLSVIAFGSVSSGSITAFLVERAEEKEAAGGSASSMGLLNLANTLVSIAVLLTYPLQLFPSYELVGPWWSQTTVGRSASKAFGMLTAQFSGGHEAVPDHDTAGETPESPSDADASGLNGGGSSSVQVETQQHLVGEQDSTTVLSATNADTPHYMATPTSSSISSPVQSRATIIAGAIDGDSPMLRAALVLFTYTLAIAVPNVQLLVSLAGALSGSATALIIPPMLMWKYYQRKQDPQVRYAALATATAEAAQTGDTFQDEHALGTSTSTAHASQQGENQPFMSPLVYMIKRAELIILFTLGIITMFIGTGSALADIIEYYMA